MIFPKHKIKITKGELNSFEKISEEYMELLDVKASDGGKLWQIVESVDLMAATADYIWKESKVPLPILALMIYFKKLIRFFK